MNTLNILVTGGAGFIGSQIADAMIAEEHHVVILDDLSTGKSENLNPKAEFVRGSITDSSLVHSLFERCRFDIVNHHAAQLDLRKSVEDPVFDSQTNIIGTLTLLEAARKQGGVRRFVFASSGGAVYGEQIHFPADETHPTNPISPYGVTKRSVELYLNYYKEVHGIEYTAFRYTNVYGPRQSALGEAGVVAIFIDRLLSNKKCIINGDGKQTRDYVFVEDLVRAHLLTLQKTEGSKIYNISTGIETDVNTIFAELSKLTSNGVSTATHGAAKPGEQQRSVCSADLIRRELGWSPMVQLSEGLRKTIDWFTSQRA